MEKNRRIPKQLESLNLTSFICLVVKMSHILYVKYFECERGIASDISQVVNLFKGAISGCSADDELSSNPDMQRFRASSYRGRPAIDADRLYDYLEDVYRSQLILVITDNELISNLAGKRMTPMYYFCKGIGADLKVIVQRQVPDTSGNMPKLMAHEMGHAFGIYTEHDLTFDRQELPGGGLCLMTSSFASPSLEERAFGFCPDCKKQIGIID
jgi:hypothetical protein